MENKIITIRSVYKVKEYHLQPTKQKNGLNWPWVKPTRIGLDGRSEMILSDAERNNPDSAYFIPEDLDVVIMDGTTFNLADKRQENIWNAIKECDLIAPSRDARDSEGVLRIDGDAKRYGTAELYVDVPGEESQRSVNRQKQILEAQLYVSKDSTDGRLTKCVLLGKNFRNAPASDIEDYLYQVAAKTPAKIIELYTSDDVKLQLLLIKAKEKNIIRKKNGVYMYGETVLGMTDEAVINSLKMVSNKAIYDEIKRETFPDYVQKVSMEPAEPLEPFDSEIESEAESETKTKTKTSKSKN